MEVTIFGYNWFDLLQIILIFIFTRLQCRTTITKQVYHSEVTGYPSGET